MFFADAGLTATLTREFARGDIDDSYRRNLLRTIELVYLGIAIFLFLIIFVFSDFIVNQFLKSNILEHDELRLCVQIMGLTMAVHFMYSLYSGGLCGLQKQVLSNVISVTYSFSRCALVIIPLMIAPTILSFFLWQLLSIIIALFFVRRYLVHSISGSDSIPAFRKDYLKSIWKFAFGMMLMAVISALNTQLDKLVTGNVLSLEDLGYYSLASTIGIAVISILQPIGVAIYPELTRLLSCNKQKMEQLLLIFSYIVSSLSAAASLTLFLYIDEFTYLWTHNESIVQAIHIPARLLIAGNFFQSLQLPAYFLALANGHTKTNVKLGLGMLIFMIPSVFIFTRKWGLNATAVPYLILNVLATFYFAFFILRRFMRDQLYTWVKYTIIPVGFISVFLLISYFILLISGIMNSALIALGVGSILCIISIYVAIRLFIRMVPEVIDYVPARARCLF